MSTVARVSLSSALSGGFPLSAPPVKRRNCEIAPGIVATIQVGKEVSADEFLKTAAPCSLAGDGYVRSASFIDWERLIGNLDHHHGVNRLICPSTAKQGLDAITNGLLKRFNICGLPTAHLFFNHCDPDVVWSLFLFRHLSQHPSACRDPRLIELVRLQDQLDRHAGACKLEAKTGLMQSLAWINEPCMGLNLNGLDEHSQQLRIQDTLDESFARAEACLRGQGRRVVLDSRYKDLSPQFGGSSHFAVIQEIGPYARLGAANDGHNRLLTVRRNPQDNRTHYMLITCDNQRPIGQGVELADRLNAEEGRSANTGGYSWFGCNLFVSSRGSNLPVQQVVDIAKQYLSI